MVDQQERERTSRILDSIELRFGKISAEVKQCELSGIIRDVSRIVDNGRALRDEAKISPTDYLAMITRIDEIATSVSRDCSCKRRKM